MRIIIILGLGVLVMVGMVIAVVAMLSRARRLTQKTLDEGETTNAWIVWASERLYRIGDLDGHAKVLISPDADDALMTRLQRMMVRIVENGPQDDTEEELATALENQGFRPREWTLLLSELTDDATVYMTDVAVEIKDLPERKLTQDILKVKVLWDEIGSPVVMIPPRRRKKTDELDD